MSKNNKIIVIGIAGHPASGKDLAAEHFELKGFAHISMGDFLRSLMKEEGIHTDRSHIHEFVKEKRKRHGNGYPANELVHVITGASAITGFRNVAEVDIFRKKFGDDFTLLAVDAPVELRYERIRERKRAGDDISFERFKEEEDAERMEKTGTHEVDRVLGEANFIIENTSTKEEFFAKLDKIFPSL